MKRSPVPDASPAGRSANGSESKKRVRFDVSPSDEPAREGPGFALRLIDAAGEPVAESPLHVAWSDGNHFELGRQFFVQRGSPGLGKHITRVSRHHIKIVRNEDDGVFMVEDLSANGTWLNGAKLGKGVRVKLPHNSILTLIYDEQDVPLLQFRFLCSSKPSQSTSSTSTSPSSSPAQPPPVHAAGVTNGASNGASNGGNVEVARDDGGGGGGNGIAHGDNDWIGRNSVSISAGLVLLASALAASWANI